MSRGSALGADPWLVAPWTGSKGFAAPQAGQLFKTLRSQVTPHPNGTVKSVFIPAMEMFTTKQRWQRDLRSVGTAVILKMSAWSANKRQGWLIHIYVHEKRDDSDDRYKGLKSVSQSDVLEPLQESQVH